MDLLDVLTVLRIANTLLGVLVGAHLVVTAIVPKLAPAWTIGVAPARFLRLGTGWVLLTISYGTINAMADGVPPSETVVLMFVGLAWSAVGTGWSMATEIQARRRPPAE